MVKVKRMGVSPITNTIYYGTVDTDKNMWVGAKTDVTDMAIDCVFEWFVNQMKANENQEEYQITYASSDYKLVMRKKDTNGKYLDNEE